MCIIFVFSYPTKKEDSNQSNIYLRKYFGHMDVPKFPPPPKLPSKLTHYEDGNEDVTSPRVFVEPSVSTETRASRRRNAIVRKYFLSTRGGCDIGFKISGYKTVCDKITSRCFVKNFVQPIKRNSKRSYHVQKFNIKMTEHRDDDDDDVVVCANVKHSPKLDNVVTNGDITIECSPIELNFSSKSIGIQTSPTVPYRLRMLPTIDEVSMSRNDESTANKNKSSIICKHLRFIGRLTLCQFGLAWLLSLWAIAGASAFYGTEGPREREQVNELSSMQKELAISLATELRQVKAEEPIWGNTVEKYVIKHEKLLLAAVSSGYGENGGGSGEVWTLPGCFLFAVSLLTTLGFGAPVPRTTAGRTVAVIFAAVGIPAHFLLILNIGIFLAVRLQNFAIRRNLSSNNNNNNIKRKKVDVGNSPKDQVNADNESGDPTSVPKWVKLIPFAFIAGYYLLGIICFGVLRLRPIAEGLLFPLDFTAAGGLATTSGPVRVAYAFYLEGAVTIAAVAVAILQVSATQGLTNFGLRYGLLTND